MQIWVSEIDLQDLIGAANTVALLQDIGGQRIYIPVYAQESHRLAKIIGKEGLQALIRQYGGNTIALPSPKDKRNARKEAFVLFGKGGFSHAQIAQELRIGVRYVEMLAKEYKEQQQQPKQLRLFGKKEEE